ncbi:MAG: hypothetical protein LBC39_06880 [Methanobrevibacter sp.]|nr:hypothetical protein [Candidatus Methanovirga aequatorialis]
MVNVNNKNGGSHIKDYSSAKIQISKDNKPMDKFSKHQSSSQNYSNRGNNDYSPNQHRNISSQGNNRNSTSKPDSNNSLIDDLKSEIKSLKHQLDEQKKESRVEISDLKKKIFILHNEKSKLSKDVEINEVKEIDHKLKNVEKLKQDLLKSQHKNTVIKDLLDETREDLNSLKNDNENLIQIIEDFDNLGFIDAIKQKKPDSYYQYFKEKNSR